MATDMRKEFYLRKDLVEVLNLTRFYQTIVFSFGRFDKYFIKLTPEQRKDNNIYKNVSKAVHYSKIDDIKKELEYLELKRR